MQRGRSTARKTATTRRLDRPGAADRLEPEKHRSPVRHKIFRIREALAASNANRADRRQEAAPETGLLDSGGLRVGPSTQQSPNQHRPMSQSLCGTPMSPPSSRSLHPSRIWDVRDGAASRTKDFAHLSRCALRLEGEGPTREGCASRLCGRLPVVES
jgi:hypothetical protein